MRSFRGFGAAGQRSRRYQGRRIGSHPWHYYALIGLLGVVVTVDAQTPTYPAYQAVPSAPTSAAPVTGTPTASPLDRPLQLIEEARQTFLRVSDYACLLVTQERLRGQLLPEHVIDLKMRNNPFSVSMRWLAPRHYAGQEVCYVAGRNNGMMRVHSTGIKGVVGFVAIAPNDPRVLEHSRHTITETGIGNIIASLGKEWLLERPLNKTQVRSAEYEYDKRRCIRVEAIHPERGGPWLYYRTVAYFDKEHHLPIRVENYDWPRQGGSPDGDLVESYSYTGLRLNVNLSDALFNR